MGGGGGSPKIPKPPPPAPQKLLPQEVDEARRDLQERLRRARSRAGSIRTGPGMLLMEAPIVQPMLYEKTG